jgi:hypothetical protein
MESHTEDIGVISTIRSQSLREEEEKKKRRKGEERGEEKSSFCQKCCRAMKREVSFEVGSLQRSPIYSPVLQVKNYQIASPQKDCQPTEFQLLPKRALQDAQCQASLDGQAV